MRKEFQKVVAHGCTGPKLDASGRLLVVSCVIEGLSNEVIRTRLQDAGHPTVSTQALQRYRRSAEVRRAVNAVVDEASDLARISLYGRLVLLNAQVEEMLQVLSTYGERKEVIGVDKDGNAITRIVDDRRTREYNELHHVLLSYLKEISRLVDRPRRHEPIEPRVPTFEEQVQTAMEALLGRSQDDRQENSHRSG